MLIAPDAPVAIAMQRMATAAITGWMWPGATITPANPVKTTSDMTLGLSSATKSDTAASCGRVATATVPPDALVEP